MNLRKRSSCRGLALVALAVLAAGAAWAADPPGKPKGFVDKQMFLDLLPSEDPVRVEVTIPKSLIKTFCAGLDEDLKKVACGLDSIEALILEVEPGLGERITKLMNDVDRDLQKGGWERIVLVRDRGEQARVLIFNDEQAISGLVVMVVDGSEMVFVNVAGSIDLGAMQRIAGEWDIPGLEHLQDYESKEGGK